MTIYMWVLSESKLKLCTIHTNARNTGATYNFSKNNYKKEIKWRLPQHFLRNGNIWFFFLYGIALNTNIASVASQQILCLPYSYWTENPWPCMKFNKVYYFYLLLWRGPGYYQNQFFGLCNCYVVPSLFQICC